MSEPLKLYLAQIFYLRYLQALSDEGYDVVRASEVGQTRAYDQQILEETISDNRVLITLDEHFGDWVTLPLMQHPGVIRHKVNPTTSKNILRLLIPFLYLNSLEQFKDRLIIIKAYKMDSYCLIPIPNPQSIFSN